MIPSISQRDRVKDADLGAAARQRNRARVISAAAGLQLPGRCIAPPVLRRRLSRHLDP